LLGAALHSFVARVAQLYKRQLCSFIKRCQPYERLSAADKDWILLNSCVKGKRYLLSY